MGALSPHAGSNPALSAILNCRIEPGLKEAVPTAAVNEHRAIANRTAVMIRD